MAPAQQPNEFPYADFLEQFMGSPATGRGIDHSGPSSHPSHWPGFPFGRPPHPPPPPPAPPGHGPGPVPPPPHGRHGRHHPHHPHRPDQEWGWGGWDDRHGGGWDEADFDFSDRGHGRHGRGRRHHHHDSDEEGATRERPLGVSNDEKPDKSADENPATASGDDKNGSPDTMKGDVPDPEEMVPEYEEARPNNNETFTGGFGGFGGFGHGYGWGGRGGRGGRGGCGRGSGRRHHHDRSGSHFPNPAAPPGGFNLPDMMRGFMSDPFLQHMGAAARSFQNPDSPSLDESTFSPPVDIFNTPAAYVLHVALPGAKRDDVGVHWDPERGALSVSGVVHRPGDEAFLQTMHSSERRVGVFARSVALPPRDAGEQQSGAPREEIDAEGIAAKLDDGVLVIMVPKMEKEWTEVRKVDIL